MAPVEMTCMTTKQKFTVEDPDVRVLQNGRYAYRVKCPWEGKNGKHRTGKLDVTTVVSAFLQWHNFL